MPVNEKILFRSFQYLFSLKSIIYAILSLTMLRENHAVFLGKNYSPLPLTLLEYVGGGRLINYKEKEGTIQQH